MTPRDLFLRGRQLFGFLLPGALWLMSLLTIIGMPEPPAWIAWDPTMSTVVVAVVGSYLLGLSMASISFWFAKNAGTAFGRFQNLPSLNDLESTVRDTLPATPRPSELFGHCKRLIRIRSESLAHHLDGYEEEINLLGMLPLPLLVFGFSWVAAWISVQPRLGILGAVVSLWLAGYFTWRLPFIRVAEKKECYEMLLLLQGEEAARRDHDSR